MGLTLCMIYFGALHCSSALIQLAMLFNTSLLYPKEYRIRYQHGAVANLSLGVLWYSFPSNAAIGLSMLYSIATVHVYLRTLAMLRSNAFIQDSWKNR